MPKLTKADLLAKITTLEAELGLSNEHCMQLQRELDAQYVEQRPSRRMGDRASTDFTATVVVMQGKRCVKVKQWEHGRLVTTYKPVQ